MLKGVLKWKQKDAGEKLDSIWKYRTLLWGGHQDGGLRLFWNLFWKTQQTEQLKSNKGIPKQHKASAERPVQCKKTPEVREREVSKRREEGSAKTGLLNATLSPTEQEVVGGPENAGRNALWPRSEIERRQVWKGGQLEHSTALNKLGPESEYSTAWGELRPEPEHSVALASYKPRADRHGSTDWTVTGPWVR